MLAWKWVVCVGMVLTSVVLLVGVARGRFAVRPGVEEPGSRHNSARGLLTVGVMFGIIGTAYGPMGAPMWAGLASLAMLVTASVIREVQVRRAHRRR